LIVTFAGVFWRACALVRVFRQRVLVDMIAVHMVQMIVVQIASMVAVLDRFVSARSAVSMFVIVVSITGHRLNLFRSCLRSFSIFMVYLSFVNQ
jgi:hypothetical protein